MRVKHQILKLFNDMVSRERLRSILRVLVGPALIAVIAWQSLRVIFPERSFSIPVSYCNLNQGACHTYAPIKLRMEILPRPIVAGKENHITIELDDPSIDRAELELSAVDVDLGTTRSELQRTGSGFTGRVLIPICEHGNLRWQAMVILHRGDSVRRISFFWKNSSARFLSFLEMGG